MFNFKQELAKYRDSLEVEDLAEGLSGDEIQDILDIAKVYAKANAKANASQEAFASNKREPFPKEKA